MSYIIDRFEGSFAVCEDENGSMVNIKLTDIKGRPKEGDVIDDDLCINTQKTRQLRQEAQALQDELFAPKSEK